MPPFRVHLFPGEHHRWPQAQWDPHDPYAWVVEGTRWVVPPRSEYEVTLKSGIKLILHGRDVEPPPEQLDLPL
jgi:hypothetical protein